jgi:hypothetical protein
MGPPILRDFPRGGRTDFPYPISEKK